MLTDKTPYILYGAPHSLYTGKARCYLRNQGIPYIERATTHPDFAARILPQIGRGIIPVLETPCGQVIQDTVDIIDYFENRGVPYPVYPEGPLQRAVAVIIEYYGGQSMLKHAMHYRWSYLDQQEDFLVHAFASGSGAATAEKIMGRMQGYLPHLGVTEQSIPEIERSYESLLAILDAHFEQMPYLLGDRPCVGDYGMIGSLFAHLGRDPVPAQIMKLRAPRVYRWVERMTAPGLDVLEYPERAAAFWPEDAIPPSLEPLLEHIASEIFPELNDKLAFISEWVTRHQPADGEPVTEKPQQRQLGMVQTSFKGVPLEVGVEPYLLFLLQRAVGGSEGIAGTGVRRVDDYLQRFGLLAAVPRGLDYGVTRRNNIEVWARNGRRL